MRRARPDRSWKVRVPVAGLRFTQTSLSDALPQLLIILDRNIDLKPCLMHVWTYMALVSDAFTLALNRVALHPEPGTPLGKVCR